MTFTDSLNNMSAATSVSDTTTKNAAKRSSMFGYAWKFTHSKNGLQAIATSGDYYLAMVNGDGDQFIYKFTKLSGKFEYKGKVAHGASKAIDASTAPAEGTALSFDAELMEHIGTGSDWTTNTQTTLDQIRIAGQGAW